MKNLRYIIFVLAVVVFFILIITTREVTKVEPESNKPLVALSTFSLYDVAKHISADTLELFTILPAGVDTHSFEPTPKLMVNIHKSDLVVYNGAGLEPWILNFESKRNIIDMSKHVKLIELHAGHEHEEESVCTHSSVDPHYWLDIENMIKVANILTEEFVKIIPKNIELYEKNRDSYIKMLSALDVDYKNKLSSCKKKTIIVNHNAFSYLSSRYDFSVEALSGLSPEAEPSAKSMLRLIEHVREHNISTVFFESFVSDVAIRSIANEANVEVDVLHPLGNITADDLENNLTFEDIMRSNLMKISKALECR